MTRVPSRHFLRASRVALPPLTMEPIGRRRRVVVLGSTGSIGMNCLHVIGRFEDRLQPIGFSAHTRWQELAEQARRYRPRWSTLTDPDAVGQARQSAAFDGASQLLEGEKGITTMVTDPDVDLVVAAIVGSVGLLGTGSALEAAKTGAGPTKGT